MMQRGVESFMLQAPEVLPVWIGFYCDHIQCQAVCTASLSWQPRRGVTQWLSLQSYKVCNNDVEVRYRPRGPVLRAGFTAGYCTAAGLCRGSPPECGECTAHCRHLYTSQVLDIFFIVIIIILFPDNTKIHVLSFKNYHKLFCSALYPNLSTATATVAAATCRCHRRVGGGQL